jgi:hypothetical protein
VPGRLSSPVRHAQRTRQRSLKFEDRKYETEDGVAVLGKRAASAAMGGDARCGVLLISILRQSETAATEEKSGLCVDDVWRAPNYPVKESASLLLGELAWVWLWELGLLLG